MTIAANEVLHFHAYLVASATLAATGIQLAINGPTPATDGVAATIIGWTNATTLVSTGIVAYETDQTNGTSAGTTRRVFEIYGRVINGANPGTFALRFKSENTNPVTIHRGSWMQYFKGPN